MLNRIRAEKNRNLVAAYILLAAGFLIVGIIYFPLIKEEMRYGFSKKNNPVFVLGTDDIINISDEEKAQTKIINPIDEDFGIVIAKIQANAKVISDVDANDSRIYQKALTKGVAHAKGTAHPGELGNVFIFAHSGLDLPEALRYNAIFYLLNKLEKGDLITVFYKGAKFEYKVEEKSIVRSDAIEYLSGSPEKKTLTLMTCWPAGTTFKRLVVVANQL